MTDNFSIVQSLPDNEWRLFLENHSEANIFHTPEMFQVYKNAAGYSPELWAVLQQDNILALFIPVRVSIFNGVLGSLSSRSISYGSLLCAPSEESRSALKQLLTVYTEKKNKNKPLYTELRNQYDLSAFQGVLIECGYAHEEHLNYLIDLSASPEELWKRMHKGARENIKKARQKGVTILEVTRKEELPDAYALLKQTYNFLRVPLASSSLFESAFNILYPLGMIKILFAQVENKNIGVAVRLLYKGTIFAWYSGVLREYSQLKAHELLNWYVIEWGANHGFSTFDLGGAGKPNQNYGPRDFKAKFGGDMVNYGREIYVHRPNLLRLSEYSYSLFRNLFKSK